ncbi:MAG: pyridoxal-phosphate-dependent aminotransferase family protein [Planctomycetota bacterium]
MIDRDRPPRLYIPGPVEVEPEILEEMTRPMLGHRAPDFSELAAVVHADLKRLLRTEDPVLVSTSSATGVMEGAVRNCVRERVLCCVNGAFSDRWHKICLANGIAAERLEVEWGRAVKPEMVREALEAGGFDAVTLVHNETSTGVMSPLEEIAEAVRGFGDVCLLVDAVSSLAVVPIETGALGVDVLLAGSHKGLALPPGLAVFALSGRALERAAAREGRGSYFDFVALHDRYRKNQTPNTPAVSLYYALRKRLAGILADRDGWYAEHRERCELTRRWARERFALFAEEGYESVSVTSVRNTRGISVADLNRHLREHGCMISNGYGVLKEKTFRIGHMGANDVGAHRELLALIDRFLEGK